MYSILSSKTINIILLSALVITSLSVWLMYQSGSYPASIYVDSISTILIAGALLARHRLSIDIRLGLLIFSGTISGLAAAVYNPLSSETMLVLVITVSLSLVNWDGKRALIAPMFILFVFTLMAILALTDTWHMNLNGPQHPDSLRLWLVTLVCFWLENLITGLVLISWKGQDKFYCSQCVSLCKIWTVKLSLKALRR